MSKRIILVTGAGGQLARSIAAVIEPHPLYAFEFVTKEKLSIVDAEGVRNYFSDKQPAFCINCAAYTAVDKAESATEEAFHINADGVEVLARTCAAFGTKFIHISTDYVFDGTSVKPYVEDDKVEPINVYGQSKAKGEENALRYNPEAIIIRTSWVYSEYGKNFVKTMIRLMTEKRDLNVVDDQIGAPTYASDLAEAILRMIDFNPWKPGIYHYCNDGQISWYDFAQAIKDSIDSACILHSISTDDYPTPAKRPKYSLLDTSKIKREFELDIPFWKDSLKKCIGNIQRQ